MIYLNQAATSYPKPQCVLDAFNEYMNGIPSGQMRSSVAAESGDVMNDCRKSLGKLLGVSAWNRIFFTSGATESANLLIQGMDWTGYHVFVTQTEHNSILRPVMNHPALAGRVHVIPCDETGYVSAQAVEHAIQGKQGMVIVNHCSNVTGTIQPVREIAEAARQNGCLVAVDASQSAGCIPVSTDDWGADALVFTGHKSLMGLTGTGGIYVRPGLEIRPLKFGGTGTDSRKLQYGPREYEYEPGTQNLAGIAALKAGVDEILSIGTEVIHAKEQEEMDWLWNVLAALPGVCLYGPAAGTDRGPVLSFNFEKLSASDAAYILNEAYHIIIRTGLHCAPLIHEAIGSGRYGTLRISISRLTTHKELETFAEAVGEISRSLET